MSENEIKKTSNFIKIKIQWSKIVIQRFSLDFNLNVNRIIINLVITLSIH